MNRGAALLAVLWLSVVLSFIALALSTTVRTEVEATRNLVEEERGYFLACGALEATIQALTGQPSVLRPGQRELEFEFETGTATVELIPETAKLDVNRASRPVLARLFAHLGLPEHQAVELALAVEHWRSPAPSTLPDALDRYYAEQPDPYRARHRPFEWLAELLLVRSMTRELFYGSWQAPTLVLAVREPGHGARGFRRPPLEDLLTVRGGTAVDPNYAHPLVLASLLGLDARVAEALVAARQRQPFETLQDALQQIPAVVSGETLGYLSLAPPSGYMLVARGRARDAELARSVRLTFQPDEKRPLGHRVIEWADRPL